MIVCGKYHNVISRHRPRQNSNGNNCTFSKMPQTRAETAGFH